MQTHVVIVPGREGIEIRIRQSSFPRDHGVFTDFVTEPSENCYVVAMMGTIGSYCPSGNPFDGATH
jgi:hypothetical protein